ncbi:alpha-amylase family protein [Streptomyces acidicola]|uniref:alpha-amylase family protein n=1 Tax=Streptomyces acidicola TaxID=2596892 RepID=UPI003447A661
MVRGRDETAEVIARLARHRPGLVELATCLSLTIDIDRAFLRRTRLHFLPRTTAALEAELWFSPLVEAAGSHALLLDAEAAEFLRTDLARRSPERLQEVRDFTAAEHARAPLVVRLYDELLWSGLRPTDAVELRATRLLQAVSGEGVSSAVADDMGRWALHYARRLPPHLLRRDDVWRIQVASCERLGLDVPADHAGRPVTVTAQARARVQQSMAVGVTARSDGIVLSRPASGDARVLWAKGTWHKVRVDALSSLAHTTEPVRLELLDGHSVHLPFTVVQRIDSEGELRMSLAHPGTALDIAVADRTGTGPDTAHCAVLLSDGTIVLHDGDGAENGRIPADGPHTERSRVALSPDGTVVSYVQDGVRHDHALRPGVEERDDEPFQSVVPVSPEARARDGSIVVHATPGGRVLSTPVTSSGSPEPLDLGHAPWQVSSLALSTDGQWVAVVGNDSLLIELPLVPSARPRETRLRFCASQVFAAPDGGWVVAGTGGPVELRTEDGRGYRVVPEVEPPADAGGAPLWSRGRLLVETTVARMQALADVPGVDCLVVDPNDAAEEERATFAHLLSDTHRHGVRVVVGLDVSASQEELIDAVCHWLDLGVDGLRLTGTDRAGAAVLEDVRHLVDAYDERVLLAASAPPGERLAGFAMVPASALLTTLGFALRSRTMGGGAFEQALSRLQNQIRDMFAPPSPASPDDGAALPPVLELPPALPRTLRRLAATILLSLPGSPVLPEDIAGRQDLRALLELRRNHLALSRGTCRVLDAGTAHVLAMARRHGDDAVLCLVNVAQYPTTALFHPGHLGTATQLQDLIDGSVHPVPEATAATVPIAAGSARWFRCLTP